MDAAADALELDVLADAAIAALGDLGGRVSALHRREVHHRPGDEVIVGFDVVVRWPDGSERSELVHVAASLADDHGPPHVWCYPYDPLLPGLADAVSPDAVAALLGVSSGDVQLEVRTLRPCRRAVIAVRGAGVDVHLKVVPPGEADRVVARHRAFAGAGLPVAPVVAADRSRGWVVLATLAGVPLDRSLDDPSSLLPRAADLAALVERIADVELVEADVVPPSASLVGRHAAVITSALPSLAARAEDVAATIVRVASAHVGRTGTVHGDLHAGQLLVDDQGAIVGLLDLDDAGRGDVLDEHARLLAHLVAGAVLADPARAARHWGLATEVGEGRSSSLDAGALAPRVAASLLGWATAPWRAQDASWPERVEALLAVTEDVLARGVGAAIRSRRSP